MKIGHTCSRLHRRQVMQRFPYRCAFLHRLRKKCGGVDGPDPETQKANTPHFGVVGILPCRLDWGLDWRIPVAKIVA